MRTAGSQAFQEALAMRQAQARRPSPEDYGLYEQMEDAYEEAGLPSEQAGHLAAETVVHGEDFSEEVPMIQAQTMRLQEMGWPRDAAGHLAVEAIEDPWLEG